MFCPHLRLLQEAYDDAQGCPEMDNGGSLPVIQLRGVAPKYSVIL